MVASWVRRDFAGIGITQFRPGPHLSAVQEHFRGRALLCIDVSGSMAGEPLSAARAGGLDFLTEAAQAHYDCGLVLWSNRVVEHVPTTAPDESVRAALRGAVGRGGTALAPALRAAIDELGPLTGDRVVCVFGDGAVGDEQAAGELAAEARALGVRFVVRGLGARAGESLSRVLTPGDEDAARTVRGVQGLRRGIASMVADLRSGR